MTRRKRLLAGLSLLAIFGVLAFPGAGSALAPSYTISLTSSGPSPVALTRETGTAYVVVRNTDTVTHSIAFANGLCSEPIAAGGTADCNFRFLTYAGNYAYTVDGTNQGNVLVEAAGRSVTLRARNHAIGRGSVLRLHGTLKAYWPGAPPGSGVPQPIMILSRKGHHLHRVAVVMANSARTSTRRTAYELFWTQKVRPRTGTTYLAEAVYKPKGGRVWEQAFSKPFRVRVRP